MRSCAGSGWSPPRGAKLALLTPGNEATARQRPKIWACTPLTFPASSPSSLEILTANAHRYVSPRAKRGVQKLAYHALCDAKPTAERQRRAIIPALHKERTADFLRPGHASTVTSAQLEVADEASSAVAHRLLGRP